MIVRLAFNRLVLEFICILPLFLLLPRGRVQFDGKCIRSDRGIKQYNFSVRTLNSWTLGKAS